LLEALPHLLAKIHVLLSRDLSVRDIEPARHDIEEELLSLVRNLGAHPNVLATGHLVPTFSRILIHHAAAAEPTAAKSATSAESASAGSTGSAAGKAAATAATGPLAHLGQCRGRTE
jgi:hypothetical protein